MDSRRSLAFGYFVSCGESQFDGQQITEVALPIRLLHDVVPDLVSHGQPNEFEVFVPRPEIVVDVAR